MNPISALIFIIFVGAAVAARLADLPIWITVVLALIGIFLGYSIKMAQQWEKAVILRLGRLHAIKGPGLFILVPIIDVVTVWIDQRIRTSEFSAEQALGLDLEGLHGPVPNFGLGFLPRVARMFDNLPDAVVVERRNWS